ncbi:MAG: hypothetical protein K2K86_01515, partial [Muribaculaceae bacterium]|nr:hypothetical protein [Muribaculaceae bacterium]
MKLNKFLKSIGLLALIAGATAMTQSCSDDDNVMGDAVVGQGTLKGAVTDEQDQPVAGVTVTDLSSGLLAPSDAADASPCGARGGRR